MNGQLQPGGWIAVYPLVGVDHGRGEGQGRGSVLPLEHFLKFQHLAVFALGAELGELDRYIGVQDVEQIDPDGAQDPQVALLFGLTRVASS